jgi:penicillin amidase
MKARDWLAVVVGAGILLAPAACLAAGAAAPVTRSETLPGLQHPAKLIIDKWGIAHIYAGSTRDAWFLQGYNAARDRLWQIDLWRKRGLGRLAASLGPAYVPQDRAARLLLYRGDMQREWNAYAPGARAVATAFTAGLNAYVAEVRSGARPMPVEFGLTGSVPEFWKPEDVVRIRSHGLVSNVHSEVERAQVACKAGLPMDQLRVHLEPSHEVKVPVGLDPCLIPGDVLKDYDLGTHPVRFSPDARSANLEEQPRSISEGSNNWVISPSHTTTGRPILANDPHRSLTIPSLRYIVHLEAPGLSLIGAGEPALPGVSLGHNDKIGFGLTIFNVDQEDLYVYALNPADPNEYRYRGRWEKMRVVHETIEVKGGPAQLVELRFTRHGPVLKLDAKAGLAFALRSIWMEPGTAPYFSSTWLATARSWQDFLKGRDRWGAPPLNLVYADTAGNIGWAPGAKVPVRDNWDGLLPVPGDGRYEWRGFLGDEELPLIYNPPSGWVATANDMNLPAGYAASHPPISFEWADRSRIDRISAVLGSKPKLGIGDSTALQTDNHDLMAGQLIALLAPLNVGDARVSRSLDRLKHWNLDETVDSTEATIYQAWVNHLVKLTIERIVPVAARDLVADGSPDAVFDFLQHPDARLGSDPIAARNELLVQGLAAAVEELEHRLGDDPGAWRWGKEHQMSFSPAVGSLADAQLKAKLSLPPVELGGSGDSPHATSFDPPSFAVVAGASVRVVLDVGDWDNAVAINSPGQSGDVASPHYSDLLRPWAAGQYVPLLFSRSAIEQAAEAVITLRPGRGR